jgi:hypothetical protein
MSKNREQKRRLKKQKARGQQAQSRPKRQPSQHEAPNLPNVSTMWRTVHLEFSVQAQLLEQALEIRPSLRQSDGPRIRRVEEAADLAALIELAPIAGGLAEYPWLKRMQAFGASTVPEIVARVRGDWLRLHRQTGAGVQERLIAALRWSGEAGAQGLADCWDGFDDYGRGLACVALGLLDAKPEADRLWTFLENTLSAPKPHWVGALWGLIDLDDPRAADALLQCLKTEHYFYERQGFLSRAGDARAVRPLMSEILDGPERLRGDAMWALTGIAHRLGREAFALALQGDEESTEELAQTIEAHVERFFKYPQEDVERHFETFYNRHPSVPADLVGLGRWQ